MRSGFQLALRTDELVDLHLQQLPQHTEPDLDRQRQQPLPRCPDQLPQRLLHALREHALITESPQRPVRCTSRRFLLRSWPIAHHAPTKSGRAGGTAVTSKFYEPRDNLRLRKPTEFALLLADGPSSTRQLAPDVLAAGSCKPPMVLGGLWALACEAAGPIIAVQSEGTGPTEPLRLTEPDVVAAPIRVVAAFSADRSWRLNSPRWCENYACTLCATVGGLRAGDRAPARSACGGGSACVRAVENPRRALLPAHWGATRGEVRCSSWA